ncbi:purine-cytosine permease family protein [Microbacterium terrisoli]|uniref:purine-cytosine permease family protein n=1 Tax=Microbacterium terrisoli TaxID=3242192 RepID=UPI0028038EA2|nr:cytosine permease [Microbacterium protaetiae]
MPAASPAPVKDEVSASTLIEHTGIEIIPESLRTAKPRDLFWPWFAANVSVFGMSYGSFVLGFGISLWQATVVSVIGIVVSFFLCGLIAIAGKRGSAPTMILSRSAFGVQGQKLPGIVSWLTSIGWETSLAITAVLATTTVLHELGWVGQDGDVGVKIVATIVVAALIVAASVLGYHTIMKLQSVLTWLTGGMTILFLILTFQSIDWNAAFSHPNGTLAQTIGALVMVMTGFGLGWINIAADWSRYQKRTASDGRIIGWNTLGGSVAPVVLVFFGLLLAGSNDKLLAAVGNDPIGALAVLLPQWALFPFLIVAILTLISGAVLGIYSSGLTLLSLGIRIPRPAAAGIDGIILTAGTILVVFFATSFIGPFQSFLITLGVPMASWAGILIADILRRKKDYDDVALFDSAGRYGAFDWTSIITMLVATGIGWGFVMNQIPDTPWNDWQGYFLDLFGWRDDWGYANLGVLFALVGSFLVTWFVRAAKIRAQEAEAAR